MSTQDPLKGIELSDADVAKSQFDQLMEDLKNKTKISVDSLKEGLGVMSSSKQKKKPLDLSFAIDPGLKSTNSNINAFLSYPNEMAAKAVSANAQAIISMSDSPIEDWLVQVYPDDAGVIHYQAQSKPGLFYCKWYVAGAKTLFNTIKDSYTEESPVRKSMWTSSTKQYLICKRVSKTAIQIPGIAGSIEVPELFGISSSTTEEEPF